MAGLLLSLLLLVATAVPAVVVCGAGVEGEEGPPIVAAPPQHRLDRNDDDQGLRLVLMPQRSTPSTRGGNLSSTWRPVLSLRGGEPKPEEMRDGRKLSRRWSRKKKALVASLSLAAIGAVVLLLYRATRKGGRTMTPMEVDFGDAGPRRPPPSTEFGYRDTPPRDSGWDELAAVISFLNGMGRSDGNGSSRGSPSLQTRRRDDPVQLAPKSEAPPPYDEAVKIARTGLNLP